MARSFNGTSDRIAADAAATFTMNAAYSVAMWVNGAQNSGAGPEREFFCEANSGSTTPVFAMSLTAAANSKKASVICRNDAGSGTGSHATTADVFDSTWHHICYTQDASGNFKMYVDGAPDITGTTGGGAATTNWLTFGCLRWFGTTLDFWQGSIAHAAKWNRQLSASEAKTLGAGLPPSHLGPTHYWPLWGVDSPEPDIGTATHTGGTLTGTSAATGGPVGLSLLTFRGGIAPFAPPASTLVANPPSGVITVSAAAPAGKVTAFPPSGVTTLAAAAPTGKVTASLSSGVVTLAAAAPTCKVTANPPSGLVTLAANPPTATQLIASGVVTVAAAAPSITDFSVGGHPHGGYRPFQPQQAFDDEEAIVLALVAAARRRRRRRLNIPV